MKDNLLIGGDYSGIQGYIYNIASKYASKNLKGRSATLIDECRHTAERIRETVGGEIIVSSGGTFLIEAPKAADTAARLDELMLREERRIYDTYGTDLYCAIAYIDLAQVGSYGEATERLFLMRDAKKTCRLAALIQGDYSAFFEPLQWHYDETDAVTGAYFQRPEDMRRCDGIEGHVTPQTLEQIQYGERLAQENGRVANFNRLLDRRNAGDLTRLGVLRMDVDNMGQAFQAEIRRCGNDLSAYKSLSRSITEFFREDNLYSIYGGDDVYVVYSGGDDIFAVGRWDRTLAFAEAIRTAFCKQPFAGQRHLGISGGIAILPAKYPIMKGAAEGGELEEMAKEHAVGPERKNSIAFLGMALNWDKEFCAVQKLAQQIVELDDALGAAFRGKVLKHHANAGFSGDAHKIANLKTYWMLAYDLGRMKARNNDKRAKDLIETCIIEVCQNKQQLNGAAITTHYHALELWAMACRWAELLIRTTKQ